MKYKRKSNKSVLFNIVAIGGLVSSTLLANAALAEDAEPKNETEVVVTATRDLAGVKQKTSTASVFGIDKPLVDTPRAITEVSDKLLSRYSIKNVYDLAAVSAGTYTGSFFGVPGSLNIRGTMADNYYNGFQGIANFANYPTPVDATSSIEIVRGPASPVYGAGQVGGYMNFIPKTGYGEDTKYVDKISGDVSVTLGTYNQKEATGNIAIPIKWGGNEAGLHLFGKVEDSDSYYIGMHPKSQVFQASFASELGPKWSLETSYQYINSDGYLKNIGWNRVTQQLIDDGLYISGSPIAKINDGSTDFITAEQFYGATGGSTLLFAAPEYGVVPEANDYTTLDPDTVSLVKLSPRTTMIDEDLDINKAYTHTFYGGLTRALEDGSKLKFETFLTTLNAKNYQSYGFGSYYDSKVYEQRVSYLKDFKTGPVDWKTVSGLSYRYTDARVKGSLNDFVLSEDRRDLSVGATADDRFNNPFTEGYEWATDNQTHIKNTGIFVLADATWGPVSLTLGGRHDNYDVDVINTGTEVAGVYETMKDKSDANSYSASLSYKFDWATFYITRAEAKSLQIDQGGGLTQELVENNSYLGDSDLKEAGVKTSQFNGRLFASLAVYEQNRTYVSSPPTGEQTVNGLNAKGVEVELRYLVTKSLGLTATYTHQKVKVMPTTGDGTFITVPSCLSGLSCTDGYGGYTFSYTSYYEGMSNGYYLHTTPENSGSIFMTYDHNGKWGLTAGATYASKTGGFLPGAIVLPSYTVARAGAYVTRGPYRLDVNIDNLFDEEYFLANSDTDANANVLPGVGRTVHIKLSRTF